MAAKSNSHRTAGISSEAVKAATGRTWTQWFALLDKAGCKKLDHRGIVAIVAGKYRVGPWWQQMVTVGYEQARGLRVKHQTMRGFSISRSKTLPAPAASLFRAWNDRRWRSTWLKDASFTIRKSTANKSLRITWV